MPWGIGTAPFRCERAPSAVIVSPVTYDASSDSSSLTPDVLVGGLGRLMSAHRIARCNPFFPGGFDPVPPLRSMTVSEDPPDEAVASDGVSGEV